MNERNSFLREPNVSFVMKCASCGETLLFGRQSCQYCGAEVDREYALKSAILSTIAAQACSLANTIRTGRPALIIMAAEGLLFYFINWKIPFGICVLGVAVFYCLASVRWRYRYADLEIDDSDFKQTKKEMKRYLHLWLAFVAVLLLVLLTW